MAAHYPPTAMADSPCGEQTVAAARLPVTMAIAGWFRLQRLGHPFLERQNFGMLDLGYAVEQRRRVGDQRSADLSGEMRKPVFLTSKRIEDREIARAEFDGIPVDRPILLQHVVQRSPEEVFDLVLLAFLGLDTDERCAVDH